MSNDNLIPLSKLKIEPHLVSVDVKHCDHPILTSNQLMLWRVFVDDIQLAEIGYPFSPNTDFIELHTNLCAPTRASGSRFVAVSRVGQYILWRGGYLWSIYGHLGLEPGQFFVFEALEYEQVVDTAIKQTDISLLPFFKEFQNLQKVPSLSVQEVESLLKPLFPHSYDAFYRYPDNPDDPTGSLLIEYGIKSVEVLFDDLVRAHKSRKPDPICVSEPPEKWIDIRIGLDLQEFAEAHWRIGKTTDGNLAIQFVTYPSFPLWLCGKNVEKAFGDEPFLKDL